MADAPKPALVALRDRREAVIATLTDNFANDLLDVDAFEDRLGRAHAATSVAELDDVIGDLGPLPSSAERAALQVVDVDLQLAATQNKVRAIFSSIERRGGWTVPRNLRTLSVFGSAVLDFREARFAEGVTELHVRAVFGNIEIIVPPHLAVDCQGSAVFASFESHAAAAIADPGRPLLRITGSAVFGNVEISTRRPSDNEQSARRLGSALPGPARHALPAVSSSPGSET